MVFIHLDPSSFFTYISFFFCFLPVFPVSLFFLFYPLLWVGGGGVLSPPLHSFFPQGLQPTTTHFTQFGFPATASCDEGLYLTRTSSLTGPSIRACLFGRFCPFVFFWYFFSFFFLFFARTFQLPASILPYTLPSLLHPFGSYIWSPFAYHGLISSSTRS